MKKPLDFRRNNQNNADLLLSVYELTARSSLQINQRPRHQSQSREKYQFKKNNLFDKSDNKPEMTQLISVSSPGSTKKLPYSPQINLKKMPSPREHNQIMNAFIKSANEAIENNTDERLLRVYRQARLQVEQFMAKIESYDSIEGVLTNIEKVKSENEALRKKANEQPTQLQQLQTQHNNVVQQLQKLEKKAESRKVCIKKLYLLLEKNERELELFRTGKKSQKTSFTGQDKSKKNELNDLLNNAYPKNKENQPDSYEGALFALIKEYDPKSYESLDQLLTNSLHIDNEAEKVQLVQYSLRTLKQLLQNGRGMFEETVKFSVDISEKNQELWKRFLEIDLTCPKQIANLKQAVQELESNLKGYSVYLKQHQHPSNVKFQEAYQFQAVIGDSIAKWLKQLGEIQEIINQRENDQYEFQQFQETLVNRLKEIINLNTISIKESDFKNILEAINDRLHQQQEEITNQKQEIAQLTNEYKKAIKLEDLFQTKIKNETNNYDQQARMLKDQIEQQSITNKDLIVKIEQMQNENDKLINQLQVTQQQLQKKHIELIELNKKFKEDLTQSQEQRMKFKDYEDLNTQLKREIDRLNQVVLHYQELQQANEQQLHDQISQLQVNNYKYEMECKERNDKYNQQILSKQSEIKQLTTYIGQLQNEQKITMEERNQLNQQYSQLKSQHEQQTIYHEQLISQVNKLESELVLLKDKQQNSDKTIEVERKQQQDQLCEMESLQEQLELFQIQLDVSLRENEQLLVQLTDCKNQLSDQQSDHTQNIKEIEIKYQQTLQSFEVDHQAKLTELDQIRIEFVASKQRIEQVSQQLKNELDKNELKEQVITDLQEILTNSKKQNSELNEELNNLRTQQQQQTNDLKSKTTQATQHQEQINSLQQTCAKFTELVDAYEEKLHQAKLQAQQHENCIFELKNIDKDKQIELNNLNTQILSLSNQYQTSIQQLDEMKLSQLQLQQNLNESKQIITQLEEKVKEVQGEHQQILSLKVEDINKLQHQVDSLEQSKLIIIQQLSEQQQLYKQLNELHNADVKLTSDLNNQIAKQDEQITQQSQEISHVKEQYEQQIITYKNNIQEQQITIQTLNKQIEHISIELNLKLQDNSQYLAELAESQDQQQQLKLQLEQQHKRVEELQEQHTLELNSVQAQHLSDQTQIQHLQQQYTSLSVKLEESTKQLAQEQIKSELKEQVILDQQGTLQQYNIDKQQLKVELTKKQEQLKLVICDQEIIVQQNLSQVKQLQDQIANLEIKCQNYNKQIEAQELLINESKQDQESINTVIQQLTQQHSLVVSQLESKIETMEVALKSVNSQFELVQVELSESQLQNNNIQNQIMNCTQEINQLQLVMKQQQELVDKIKQCIQLNGDVGDEQLLQQLAQLVKDYNKLNSIIHSGQTMISLVMGLEIEQEPQFLDLLKQFVDQLACHKIAKRQLQLELQELLKSDDYMEKIKQLLQLESKQQEVNSEAESQMILSLQQQLQESKSHTVYAQYLDSLLQEFLYNRVNLTIQSMKSQLTDTQRSNMNDYRKKIGEVQNKVLMLEKLQKAVDDSKFNLLQYQQIVDKSEQKAVYFETECKKKDILIQELQLRGSKLPQQRLSSGPVDCEDEQNDKESEQSMTFLNFSMHEEVLYGDQSFFEDMSHVEGHECQVVDLHRYCKQHIVQLIEKCQTLSERIRMQDEDRSV